MEFDSRVGVDEIEEIGLVVDEESTGKESKGEVLN